MWVWGMKEKGVLMWLGEDEGVAHVGGGLDGDGMNYEG